MVAGGTFTITHRDKSFKILTPGPQDYEVKPVKKMGDGPRCLMASKMPISNPLEANPGPGTYPIVTKAIQANKGYTVPQSANKSREGSPTSKTGVIAYLQDSSSLTKVGTRIGLSRKFSEQARSLKFLHSVPGPFQYDVKQDLVQKRSPKTLMKAHSTL